MPKASEVSKFLKFSIVGACGFLTDLSATWALNSLTDDPLFSRIVAFLLAATMTYALNSRITFYSRKSGRNLMKYFAIQALGLAINFSIYVMVMSMIRQPTLGLVTGVVLGSGIALSANFTLSNLFLGRENQKKG